MSSSKRHRTISLGQLMAMIFTSLNKIYSSTGNEKIKHLKSAIVSKKTFRIGQTLLPSVLKARCNAQCSLAAVIANCRLNKRKVVICKAHFFIQVLRSNPVDHDKYTSYTRISRESI